MRTSMMSNLTLEEIEMAGKLTNDEIGYQNLQDSRLRPRPVTALAADDEIVIEMVVVVDS
jgi:hypothetical protein